MGVTDLLPYVTQIIGHNSVNVHQIPTKLGTEIRFNEPFKCTKFQPDWSTNSRFMADFVKCAKRSRRRKKLRKKTLTLAARISEMAGAIFFKFECGLPDLAGTSVATLVSMDKESRSYKGVKIAFTFFL